MEIKTEGINYLKQAVSLTKQDFLDPYYDLAMFYLDNNQTEEAKSILDVAKKIKAGF